LQERIEIIDVYKNGLDINPFHIEKGVFKRDLYKKALDIADAFSYSLKLSVRQAEELYNSIVVVFTNYLENNTTNLSEGDCGLFLNHNNDIVIDLEAVCNQLNVTDTDASNRLLSKMKPLSDFNVFSSKSKWSWDKILNNRDGKVTIFQMDGYPESIKRLITELILLDLWQYAKEYGCKGNPFFLVLDECQYLSYKQSSPASLILTEGRKYGFAACFATQNLYGVFDVGVISKLQQASLQMIFHPSMDEIHKLAKRIDVNNSIRMEGILKSLRKQECVVISQLENADGRISCLKTVTAIVPDLKEFCLLQGDN
jgi:hypothetical protein